MKLFTPLARATPLFRIATAVALVVALGACASSRNKAPVEDRAVPPRPASTPVTPVASGPSVATPQTASVPVAEVPQAKPLPGAENAGKPGYYTVKPGDTLIRVGLENGQNWRDIARWSGLDNPNVIEVGQVLRVVPPTADANGVVVRPLSPAGRVDSKPLDGRPGDGKPASAPAAAVGAASPIGVAASPASAAAGGTAAPSIAPATPGSAAVPAAANRDPDEDINWAWPASGPVVAAFDDVKSKGLAITGKPGDAVLAAADGRVVYAGSGLRGYGNLVIVKHNATFLTAYAHNQALLVKEDQVVRRGQKIAEMGSSDAERVQLHFEIRRQGKPVDPARLLPPR